MSDPSYVYGAGSQREASGSDDSKRVVYVAEAYKVYGHGDRERVEQLVHVTEADARKDIEISASEADTYEIHERRVWLGESDSFHVER